MNQIPIKTVLLTPPDKLAQAKAFKLPIAHMAYRFSREGALIKAPLSDTQKNDLLFLDGDSWNENSEIPSIIQQLIKECKTQHYRGAILDFSKSPTQRTVSLIKQLDTMMHKQNLRLYLPECYHSYSKSANIIISSAISGGSLQQRLTSAKQTYGSNRITLSIERCAEAFSLPTLKGKSTSLSRLELQKRIQTTSPSIFYSNELCANYFTYLNQYGSAHFILYDDAKSIHRKFSLAKNLNITECFMLYPQVDDILIDILNEN